MIKVVKNCECEGRAKARWQCPCRFFQRTAIGTYRQKYFAVQYSIWKGLTERFIKTPAHFRNPKDGAHFKNVEKYLIGKDANTEYISQNYAKDLDCIRPLATRENFDF